VKRAQPDLHLPKSSAERLSVDLAAFGWEEDYVVSAICLAAVTLANTGLLKRRRATAYPSTAGYLRWKEVIYTGNSVETDATIITAHGPEAAGDLRDPLREY
jgi:putative intracellular protease/amidase